jgi:CheY-like chemotaxis protein
MKKKILIADSVRNAIEREQSILNRVSFEIFTTLSGREALALHKANAMDLIIISLELSDISGDRLCSMIRQDNELKNVSILITCANNLLCIDRATHCGANAYITKPFHSEQLAEKVTVLLSIPRRQRYRVLLKASVKGQQPGRFFYCSTRDISTSGIMIEAEQSMDEGDVLSISFVLPGFGHVSADGEIRRIEKKGAVSGYGIHFRDLSHKDRQSIEAFILSRSELKT